MPNGTVRDSFYLRAEQTKGGKGNTVLVNKKLAAALKRYAERYPGLSLVFDFCHK